MINNKKNKIYKLHNQIKNYEWGSAAIIPEFLGIDMYGAVPHAEMWMGTHGTAPSMIDFYIDGNKENIEKKPLIEVSGELPFLFKLLAVEKPLSIQAHPDLIKAQEGYRLEEEAGLDLRSPMRNYKDPNPKPEIIYAISRFSLLAGFKQLEVIDKSLKEFLVCLPQLKEIFYPLQSSINTDSLAVFFRFIFNLSKLEKEYISELIINYKLHAKKEPEQNLLIKEEQWELMKRFASIYPEDPAILSPLYLNYIELKPGEAAYIPPGILHSYISGFGAELMVSSNNVLRGGLTPKYVNVPELMNVLKFEPYNPVIFTPSESSWFTYKCEDFSLSIMKGEGKETAYLGTTPAICLVAEGELVTEGFTFKKGESFFIERDVPVLTFNGVFSAFFASSALK